MLHSDEENQLSQASTAGESSLGKSSHERSDSVSPNGYRQLADLITEMPRMGVFRRFGFLNAMNLLAYQAELMKLEDEFIKKLKSDERSNDSRKRSFNKDWNAVTASDTQRQLLDEIRQVLETYNEQVLNQSRLVKMLKPDKRDLHYLQEYMESADMGNIHLEGIERHVWRRGLLYELVALDAKNPEDYLTGWITGFFTDIYHLLIGQHIGQNADDSTFRGSTLYSGGSIARVVSIATIGLSSIFPISSILLLDHFDDEKTRLIILSVYTLGFSVILAAVSGAKRIEVFSASAAFAAVQVVFISQDRGNGKIQK